RVRQEVLLSAGAIESPKLLMLSGIGPAEQLRRHGIDVLVDSPGVGANLQEHISGTVRVAVNVPTLNCELTHCRVVRHGLNSARRGRGAVAAPSAHAVVFANLARSHARPDFEVTFARFGLAGVPGASAPRQNPLCGGLSPMKTPAVNMRVWLC